MSLRPYLVRALLWSAAGYAAWEWFEPHTARLLGHMTGAILSLAGQPVEAGIQETHRGPVLFVALYLAHRPRWRSAILNVPLGITICLVTQALAIASFTLFPTDDTPLERLVRGAAFALSTITPILLWLLFAGREVIAASGGVREGSEDVAAVAHRTASSAVGARPPSSPRSDVEDEGGENEVGR